MALWLCKEKFIYFRVDQRQYAGVKALGDECDGHFTTQFFLLLYTQYQFARVATMKFYKLRSLNNRNLSSPSSGGWKSAIQVSAGLAPSEGSEGRVCSWPLSLACRWLSSSCFFLPSSLYVCLWPGFFFLEGHQSYWIWVHPLDYPSKALFPNKFTF